MRGGEEQEIMQEEDQSMGMLLSVSQIFDLKDSTEFTIYGQDLDLEKYRVPNTYLLQR